MGDDRVIKRVPWELALRDFEYLCQLLLLITEKNNYFMARYHD